MSLYDIVLSHSDRQIIIIFADWDLGLTHSMGYVFTDQDFADAEQREPGHTPSQMRYSVVIDVFIDWIGDPVRCVVHVLLEMYGIHPCVCQYRWRY